jgi:acetylornithine deacetylase/succinyl-diaminopimelate desuccinylase-like protein
MATILWEERLREFCHSEAGFIGEESASSQRTSRFLAQNPRFGMTRWQGVMRWKELCNGKTTRRLPLRGAQPADLLTWKPVSLQSLSAPKELRLKPCALFLVLLFSLSACAQIDDATRQLSHDIFKQLIEINTTDSVGNVTTAAEAVAQRFRDAGFAESDLHLLGPNDRKKNLVIRLHGAGKHKPVLLIGHLDVVEAHREDWTTDPFQFVEKDGFFYGRGTEDMKDGDTIMITTLLRFKKEGYVPDRDIILALTADEEGGKFNGVGWLVKNHRELIDAEFCLNHDGGIVNAEHGKPIVVKVDATEKIYADYQLTVTNPGGHSSLPVPDNAIYHLANGLRGIEHYQFPFELNAVTRDYYEQTAKVEPEPRASYMKAIVKTPPDMEAVKKLSEDPTDNSTLHTSCVATRLNAGHANNALPQRAEAIVNCRILPGHSAEETRQALVKAVADPKVDVRYIGAIGGGEEHPVERPPMAVPPLRRDVFAPLEKVAAVMWPGVPVIPDMADGASDAIYTAPAGIPTYGVSGEQVDADDYRAHGKDERMAVKSFYRGVEFYYKYLKAVTTQP